MRAGMTAGHRAAKAAIKARRARPAGGPLARDRRRRRRARRRSAVRDRKRAEVYDHWLELARDDDFVGVQNYERDCVRRPPVRSPPEGGADVNGMGTPVEPDSLARRGASTPTPSTGVPVLVSEHGVGTEDDSVRAAFIEPSLAGSRQAIDDGVPVLGYCHWTLMDNFEWIFGYGPSSGCTRSTARRSSARPSRAPASTPRSLAPTASRTSTD